MDLDPASLEGKTTREVLHELIEYVVKSEEEMDEKTTRSGDQTDLNIYICDNEGYEIGDLNQWVTHLAESDKVSGHAGNYVANHTFNEEVADDDISLVSITTPAKGREDEFVFVTNDGYLWVLTTIHSDWREKTIENFLKYLPCVERLYLSADNLEDLTERIRDSRISGFTAKYHAPNRERDATLTFSGAEPGDLRKAEETFDAKPTRIEFDQKNSPDTAIQGANTNKGRLTMRSVRDGSEPKAVETLLGLTEGYQELDRQSFSVELPPTHDNLENGFAVDGFTAVELTDPDRDDAEDLIAELKQNVLNGNQYRYGIRDSGRKVRVFDTEYSETFDVAVEGPNIILYARDTTTALSLRSFVRKVYDKLDSTYSLSKSQNPVAIK
ncbi:hypothetical protein [Halopelagius longus]|uniref:Uncharacterized protein n=1 Tax=Halopelagius longus TaxID=1236180 RepID=A0A1H1GU17_9EURY|nr:hypothetical protein [Halopelagius longus]RDI69566.1 hypothetical protein DWB78_18605 [Halopelagius longus]SDR16670.1 hypothetical protein SAMN05216278_3861 [Halopelagius longus]